LGGLKKMLKCEECGKKIGIFGGYQHPAMGKKHSLCSNCFDVVNESVTKWQDFVLQNSFNNKSKNNIQIKWKNFIPNISQRRNIIENICADTNLLFKR
jgi:hypothetical protein